MLELEAMWGVSLIPRNLTKAGAGFEVLGGLFRRNGPRKFKGHTFRKAIFLVLLNIGK